MTHCTCIICTRKLTIEDSGRRERHIRAETSEPMSLQAAVRREACMDVRWLNNLANRYTASVISIDPVGSSKHIDASQLMKEDSQHL